LQKYTKEDEAKIKELNHSIEKLMIDVNKRKAVLSSEVLETQVAQIELEKTTEFFKTLHQERSDLIKKWDQAIKDMKSRDKEIEVIQTTYQTLKEKARDTSRTIREREELYQSQLNANAEVEKKIALEERNVANLREDLSAVTTDLHQFQSEIDVMKNTLNKCIR
jgi:chromosome segregation ATPase